MQKTYSRQDFRNRNDVKPDILVIHDTEGSSLKVDLGILQAVKHDKSVRCVSAHYLIGAGGEFCDKAAGLVDVEYSAYHAGVSAWGNALNVIDEKSATGLGFNSWDDYEKRRGEDISHIACDYVRNITINTVQSMKIARVEKLQYIKAGQEHTINDARNVELEGVEHVSLNVAQCVQLYGICGVSISRAKGLNDISVGVELTNAGDVAFPCKQINRLVELCVEILQSNKISAFNIVAHADISPSNKQDPSGYFKWKDFYQGVFDKLTQSSELLRADIKKIVNILDQECEDPDSVIVDKNVVKSAPLIAALQAALKEYGYQLIEDGQYGPRTSAVVTAFNRHFCTEVFVKEKKDGSRIVANPNNARWYKLSQYRLEKLLEAKKHVINFVEE